MVHLECILKCICNIVFIVIFCLFVSHVNAASINKSANVSSSSQNNKAQKLTWTEIIGSNINSSILELSKDNNGDGIFEVLNPIDNICGQFNSPLCVYNYKSDGSVYSTSFIESNVNAYAVSIALGQNGTKFLAYLDHSNTIHVLEGFGGSDWEDLATFLGANIDPRSIKIVVDSHNIPYVSFINENGVGKNAALIIYYDSLSNSMQYLADFSVEKPVIANHIDMTIYQDTIYMLYANDPELGVVTYNIQTKKFNNFIQYVILSSTLSYPAIRINAKGDIYAAIVTSASEVHAYKSSIAQTPIVFNELPLVIQNYKGKDNIWGLGLAIDPITQDPNIVVSLDEWVSSSGVILYFNGMDVFAYDGTSWQDLKTDKFCNINYGEDLTSLSLTFDENAIMYLGYAYINYGSSYNTVVYKGQSQ